MCTPEATAQVLAWEAGSEVLGTPQTQEASTGTRARAQHEEAAAGHLRALAGTDSSRCSLWKPCSPWPRMPSPSLPVLTAALTEAFPG